MDFSFFNAESQSSSYISISAFMKSFNILKVEEFFSGQNLSSI